MSAEIIQLFASTMPKHPEPSNLPNRIRILRRAKGLKNAGDLGEKVGLTAAMISQLETGGRTLSLPHMRSIARALGVQPDELLNDADRSIVLSMDEEALLRDYRESDARGRHFVRDAARVQRSYVAEPADSIDPLGNSSKRSA